MAKGKPAASGSEKEEPKPAPQPAAASTTTTEDTGKAIGLSEAIRQGFKAVPESSSAKGGRDARRKLESWVKTTYPHLASIVDSDTFGSTLSGQRKIFSEGGESSPVAAKSSAPSVSSAPSAQDMIALMTFLMEHDMTASVLLQQLNKLANLGTLEHIRATVAFIDKYEALRK